MSKSLAPVLALMCSFVCGVAGFAHAEGPSLYPVVGGAESLPLRVLAQDLSAGYRPSRPVTPCSSGGTFGNFTVVLNCDGNDNDGSSDYEDVPDTDMAVGDQYVIQTVDNVFTIFNKSDLSVVEGPDLLTTIWTGFLGGSCSVAGSGDDFIVRYDKAAGQWIMALPIFDGPGAVLCLAVSTTSDPTGSYYLYAVYEVGPPPPVILQNSAPQDSTPQNSGQPLIWDYPKLGVWIDAYYVGFNMLNDKPTYLGPGACALDRASMLVGAESPPMQCFFTSSATDSFMLPADIAGGTQPTTGEPEFFLDIAASTDGSHDALNLWSFHVDFTDPENSTFIGPTALAVTGFQEAPNYIPEPHAGLLNSRSDRLMVPLAWRLTPDGTEHLIVNDAVTANDATTEQWFDITSPNSSPVVAQQGMLTPDVNDNFWMGSANMDQQGNIALGFNNSGRPIDPGIMFTGRLATDPIDTMEAIETVITGTGYEGSSAGGEWGDHSIMAVDPSDDCTFWYSSEYYSAANTGTSQWSTRIVEFKFTTCQ